MSAFRLPAPGHSQAMIHLMCHPSALRASKPAFGTNNMNPVPAALSQIVPAPRDK